MIIGYAGGGVRNIIVNKPVRNMAEFKGLSMRVMGAPIQTQMFRRSARAVGDRLKEVYNAIQTGVIQAAENEAAGVEQMKFYEVGPYISLTQHAITVRPVCFSGKTFRHCRRTSRPPSSRPARRPASTAATSNRPRAARLEKLAKEGKLNS